MKKTIAIFCSVVLLAACQHSKRDMLIGSWQAVSIDNPQMDALMTQGQIFIDTVGKHTDAATNASLYGVTNIDSMRHVLQLQLDSVKKMRRVSLASTMFTFRKNGMAMFTFGTFKDSTKWYFDDGGSLMLDDLKEKDAAGKIKLQIATLTDTLLKLQLTEDGVTSSVSFHPESKK